MVAIEIAIAKAFDLAFEKYKKDKESENPKTQLVKFPLVDFSYTELDDETTTQKEFNKDEPNLVFDNPYKRTCLVKEISIIPDDNFKTKGMIEIYIGDEIFFRNKKFGNFKHISESLTSIMGGKKINPNNSITMYLKSSDGAKVGITAQVTFGE